jgi:CRISPR system Cascade subunit CasB
MKEKYDFAAVAGRYERLSAGQKAELRRVKRPDDLALIPAFYRLLPGIKTDARWQRVVFFLPFARHVDGAGQLGHKLAGRVAEERLFQVLRSTYPNDLIQLRRLVQQVEPTVDWQKLGETLFYWGEQSKRRLVEHFYTHANQYEKESVV